MIPNPYKQGRLMASFNHQQRLIPQQPLHATYSVTRLGTASEMHLGPTEMHLGQRGQSLFNRMVDKPSDSA
jgi:hypothetical protein